ncbi:MAG: UDP-N-acetylmuramate--L-alanine ligase [bacterium]|nr:UDP-N-acetylmuramate--L-alanine ligase [bacterium]
MFRKSKKMHFIGIGGVGMSGIAEILINLGYEVSGSDLRESEQTQRLRDMGAAVYIGHAMSNIQDYHVVVTSSAIDQSNAEIIEARKRRIPIIHRSEMLAELVRLKHGIGVAGTHGKTTTSSMLAYLLYTGGINPTAVIGGKVLNFESNARVGEGEYIVFEADESDGTFLNLLPTIGIVTNIDADHLDYYKYFEGLKDAFLQYMNTVPFYGYSVLCIDDVTVKELLPKVVKPFITYGFSKDANFRGANVRQSNGRMRFDCYHNEKLLGEFEITLLGNHNVLNSLSAIAVAVELGLNYETIKKGLADFRGAGRRLERIGEEKGILVFDDYGHHPTEVRATLDALRNLGRRIITVFQPHRYTRTQLLWDDFGQSFANSDILFLTEIYPAGELPIHGVSSKLIGDSVKKHEGRDVTIIEKFEDIAKTVIETAQEGDVILTLGAGDIYKAGPAILEGVKNK